MGAENRSDASGTGDMEILSKTLFSRLTSSAARRNLRMASGLVLFTYIGAHLTNHALGLVSLQVAEAGLEIAVEVWSSLPGTVLLYGAAASHFLLALWAVYDRRTFRLPPAELLRIALGFTLPMILIGHAANTRLAWELYGLPSDYARVVSNLWVSDSQGWQLGLMAPGWLHGCLGLHFAFNRRPLFRQLRFVLFGGALLDLPSARDGGRGRLHHGGTGGARHLGAHRRGARSAACVPVAPGGRSISHPAGAHRAAGLPGGAAA